MARQRHRTPVVRTTVEEGILKAEAELARIEERHGRPSEPLLGAIKRGEAESPWQVCELRAIAGRAAGSPTNATEAPTKAVSRP